MVRWSAPAKRDLKQIHDYIAKDSKYYGKKVAQNIVASTEKLDQFPEMGRAVPEIGDSNVRELFVYSYRLIYEIPLNTSKFLQSSMANEIFLRG